MVIAKIRYAFRGLLYVFRHELSFRLELLAAVLVILVGCLVRFSPLAWAVVALTIGVVLVAELMNTALERLLDIIEPRLSQHVANLKDILAGGVVVVVVMALVVAWAVGRTIVF